jgi:hypothetical protein
METKLDKVQPDKVEEPEETTLALPEGVSELSRYIEFIDSNELNKVD